MKKNKKKEKSEKQMTKIKDKYNNGSIRKRQGMKNKSKKMMKRKDRGKKEFNRNNKIGMMKE